MNSEELKLHILNSKLLYMSIGSVPCPAFDNEKISFNRRGFQHLLYKKGDRRKKSVQIERLSLLKKAVQVIRSSDKTVEYRRNGNIQFWSLEGSSGDMNIVVVIAQIGNGSKYFLSVMKSTKTP